jgi:RNA polymerase sigma factor (sigma-70 family)
MPGRPSDSLSPILETVLARSTEMVRAVGWRHGLSAEDIDEVFQEVRIRLWRALETGEKIEAAPASYVYRTAVSAALDLIRRRRARREERVNMERPSGEAVLGSNPGPEAEMERGEAVDKIGRAVDALSESRRPAVRMYLAGYGREEIAELLGWSEAKTRNLIYRGLADLREKLIEEGLVPPEVSP